MKLLSKFLIFSNFISICLSHDIQNAQEMINRFKTFFDPENLYIKRNFSPLDDLFEASMSKRSHDHSLGMSNGIFKQLSNAFTAPFNSIFEL